MNTIEATVSVMEDLPEDLQKGEFVLRKGKKNDKKIVYK